MIFRVLLKMFPPADSTVLCYHRVSHRVAKRKKCFRHTGF